MYIFCILSVQKAFKRILTEEILHRMGFHEESEMFFFSVYGHINTDYKITVPQKRKSTQSTSTVMNKFFYAQLKPLTQYNGSNSCTMKM